MELVKKAQSYLEKIKKQDKLINSFIYLNPNLLEEAKQIEKKEKKGRLYGKIIAIKSNINVKNMLVTCASKTLENYYSPYDATVIKKIKAEDGLIIGMTNMDEFASGSSGETSAYNPTKNPNNPSLIPGGSSSGSAAAVAADFCDLALGSDTGGSIRNPASHCGVIGVKPSYGLVSRYGLIDLSMSLDTIGVFGKNLNEVLLLLNTIKGKDENDATSQESKEIKLEKKKFKIGLLKIKADKEISGLIKNKTEEISSKNNFKLEEVEIKNIDLAVQTYYPIVYNEFFSGTRKFDGRRFGNKIEDVCGVEVLRRILGGSEISKAEYKGKYYRKALEVKELIKKEFQELFKKFDAIILPTVPRLPHKIGEKISVEDMYSYDATTIPANLAGIPAISIPIGKINNIPVGLQIFSGKFKESDMFSLANYFL